MKLAVSNIAWPPGCADEASQLLTDLGVSGIEIAPTTAWVDPSAVGPDDLARHRDWWESRGLRVVATQALLFGHPELQLFSDPATRAQTAAYLREMIRVSSSLGAGAMVFGSPKNRRRGAMDHDTAFRIAAEFFAELGEAADAAGTRLCFEANAADYGCDFICATTQAAELVASVGSPGFALQLDTSTMLLEEEPVDETVGAVAPHIGHVHISEPHLRPIGAGALDHETIAAALVRVGYRGWISIEMRDPGRQWREGVAAAVETVRANYPLEPVA